MQPEVTLDRAAGSVALVAKVANALHLAFDDDPDIRQVIASPPYGEVVIVDSDYNHIALRVAA